MHVPRRWEGQQSPSGGLHILTSTRSGCYAVLTAGLLLLGLCFLRSPQPDLPQLRPCIPAAVTGTSAAEAPAVLAKMLVMVTFFWDINHLSFLTQVRAVARLRNMRVVSSASLV